MGDPVARPVIGWRRWRIGHGNTLWPAGWVPEWSRPEPWWPWTADHTAECHRGRGGMHSAPDWQCGCGLHAYYTPDDVPLRGGTVRGAIIAWGRIVLHETGFRAEHARIVGLLPGTPADVAALYQRPVLAVSELLDLARQQGDEWTDTKPTGAQGPAGARSAGRSWAGA